MDAFPFLINNVPHNAGISSELKLALFVLHSLICFENNNDSTNFMEGEEKCTKDLKQKLCSIFTLYANLHACHSENLPTNPKNPAYFGRVRWLT